MSILLIGDNMLDKKYEIRSRYCKNKILEVDEFLEISKELHNFVDPNFGNLNYIALINEIKNNKKE